MRRFLCFLLTIVSMNGFASSYKAGNQELACDFLHGWSFSADYLYWRPLRSDLNFANSTNSNGNFIKSVDPDWGSGYRLSLSKVWNSPVWCTQGLDMRVRYTHFHNTSRDESEKSGIFILFPTRVIPSLQQLAFLEATTLVTGEYRIGYDVVDILWGGSFNCQCLSLQIAPFAGPKLAWIDEEFFSAISSTPSYIGTQCSDFNLYGLTFGCVTHWDIFAEWLSMRARGAFSAMYADVNRKALLLEAGQVVPANLTEISSSTFVPACEVSLGLGADLGYFFCFCWDIEIGYEFQGWLLPDFAYFSDGVPADFNLSDSIVTFPARDPNAILGLHGLYVKGTIRF